MIEVVPGAVARYNRIMSDGWFVCSRHWEIAALIQKHDRTEPDITRTRCSYFPGVYRDMDEAGFYHNICALYEHWNNAVKPVEKKMWDKVEADEKEALECAEFEMELIQKNKNININNI